MLNFISWSSLFFLCASLLVYYKVPKKWQWCCLLVINCVFYAFSGLQNFLFILVSSASTFLGALVLQKMANTLKSKKATLQKEEYKKQKEIAKTKKRLVLAVVLFFDIGVLFYLKYFGVLAGFIGIKTPVLLLPLGISFYTFATFSYFMDIYNNKYQAQQNFFKYLTFVSFFPALIQGPINRYDGTGVQVQKEHPFDFENIKRGILLFLFGAMKKFCIADMLSNRIDSLLDPAYTALPGGLALLGVLFYAIYQYADFSGGIDMVMGVAFLFDIKMQQNFRQPYFSVSLADFWRRWHISLGLWMKDYVFYPFALTKTMQNIAKWCKTHLGQHAARFIPAGIANIVVFFLVGVWHGAQLHFVVWGLYNGVVIAVSDALKPAFNRLSSLMHINTKSKGFHIFQIVRTFIIVNIGWYFDRIVDVKKAFLYLKNTFFAFGSPSLFLQKDYLKGVMGSFRDVESQIVLLVIALIVVFIVSVMRECNISVYKAIQKKNIAIRFCAYYLPLILVILSFSFSPGNPLFMYAQY